MLICDRCKKANILHGRNSCGPILESSIKADSEHGRNINKDVDFKWMLCSGCWKILDRKIREMIGEWYENCQSFEVGPATKAEVGPAIKKNAEKINQEDQKKLYSIVAETKKGLQCNCDLDNWQPLDTGHTSVCRIHKLSKQLFGEWIQRGRAD